MMAHLVALVDAVDKLRAWSAPREANCGGVDGLCLHVPWWYCGDCIAWNEKYKRMNSSENGILGGKKVQKTLVIITLQHVWILEAVCLAEGHIYFYFLLSYDT